jgi:UDP-glucuronate decarboxylase
MNKNDFLIKLFEDDAKNVNENINLNFFEGKDITITGSTGLVGSNIISALVFYNNHFADKPIQINGLSFSKPKPFFYDFFQKNNINIMYGDLSDSEFILKVPLTDYLVHCAGYGQPGKFLEDKIKTIEINTTATIELSKKLKTNGKFLFLSTSELYSGCTSNKHLESDIGNTDPSHPRACYIEGKRTGEAIINALREKGTNAVSARLSLAYGPGVRVGDKRVINQFIDKGLSGQIDMLDSGDAQRTYCYISDATTMLLNILLKSTEPVYNVGGKSVISIKNLALKIGEKLDVPVIFPESKSFLTDAPNAVGLDLSLIESEFDHVQYVDLDYGLTKTIEWIRKYNE